MSLYAITNRLEQPLTAADAMPEVEQLKHLLPSLSACRVARREAKIAVDILTHRADPVWVMARVAALLLPYYEKETPQAVREMEAEDWAECLTAYPQWAIEKAVRWWKSGDNPRRSKRPIEGDIEARIFEEMAVIRAARIAMRGPDPIEMSRDQMKPAASAPRERVTAASAQRILEEAGMGHLSSLNVACKRIPGAN
jgi:hypothetical protein